MITNDSEIEELNNEIERYILTIFKDLKPKFINKNRKLEFTNDDYVFSNGTFTRKIYCNANKVKTNDINHIRFFLLHEEGHLNRFTFQNLYLCIFLIIIINFTVLWINSNFDWLKAFQSLLIVIILPVVYRLFYPLFKRDEHNSDIYAAKILKNEFSKNMPSQVISDALNPYSGKSNTIQFLGDQSKFDDLLHRFIDGYYPSFSKRIEHIRNTLDDNKIN